MFDVADGCTLRKFTVSEYHLMVAEGILRPDERVELLDGTLIALKPPQVLHTVRHRKVRAYLVAALGRAAHVERQTSLSLGDRNVTLPDIAILALSEEESPGAPERREICAVVEVADSTFLIDVGCKPRVYASQGIADYLVVDLAANALLRYREPRDLGYHICDYLRDGDTLELAALPGIRLRAGAFLR